MTSRVCADCSKEALRMHRDPFRDGKDYCEDCWYIRVQDVLLEQYQADMEKEAERDRALEAKECQG